MMSDPGLRISSSLMADGWRVLTTSLSDSGEFRVSVHNDWKRETVTGTGANFTEAIRNACSKVDRQFCSWSKP